MKNKKQTVALVCVGLLLVVAIVTGLVKPYLDRNDSLSGVPGGTSSEKVEVPDFQFTDTQDNVIHFEDLKGKPTVINFWATWCGFCVAEMADFNKIIAEYEDKVNFVMLDVVDGQRETKEKALAFLQENKYENINPYFDSLGEGTYLFGIRSFPTTVYIDKDGYLYDAQIGMTTYEKIKEVTDAMLEE